MKNIYTFLILLLMNLSVLANIGGEFYNRGVTGLRPDSGITVISANTWLNTNDSTCNFRSVYKVNSADGTFRGRFYGLRFSNIKINGVTYDYSRFQVDTLKSDISLFGRNDVIENYSGEIQILSIPIETNIEHDSTILIEGQLTPEEAEYWGLAVYSNLSAMRHPLLAKMELLKNEYVVSYILAPVQSFRGLQSVGVHIRGDNIQLYRRVSHTPIPQSHVETNGMRYYYTQWPDSVQTKEVTGNIDSVIFTKNIPDIVEYYYKRTDVKEKKRSLFSPGGPLVYIGSQSKKFRTDIGWEVDISPFPIVSILPSVSLSNRLKNFRDCLFGVRLYLMGLSLGITTKDFKTGEWNLGLDFFGPVGIEFREKAFFVKLSL